MSKRWGGLTPYQYGWVEGKITTNDFLLSEWETAQQHLDEINADYEPELELCNHLPAPMASEQREMVQGVTTRSRQDLQALIDQGY